MLDLRGDRYSNLQQQSLRFFTTARTGELMSRLNNDVIDTQWAVTGTLVSVVVNSIVVLSTVGLFLSVNWKLAAVALLVLPLFILPARQVGRIHQRLSRETAERRGVLTAMMAETLSVSGALLVKAFGCEADETAHFG